ncbi:30S ribosomal protein S19 [Candidatus Woesearchaeota archaeon]|nr:30S ribosomal protein S19 [Candidatus Woesearchaeota archaeon]
MMKKAFSYKGNNLEELRKMSLTELAALLPSNARRKIQRLGEQEKKFIKKVHTSKKPVKTHLRSMMVLPSMVGRTVMVHNGKGFQSVNIIEEMIGHRLGEFVFTRTRVAHSAPGIGATRSSASLSVK